MQSLTGTTIKCLTVHGVVALFFADPSSTRGRHRVLSPRLSTRGQNDDVCRRSVLAETNLHGHIGYSKHTYSMYKDESVFSVYCLR